MASPYKKDGIKYPRCTNIISEMTGGPPLQWSANEVVNFIKEQAHYRAQDDEFVIYGELLDKARFAYKDISKQALDDGSWVHGAVEEFLKTGKVKPAPTDEADMAFDNFFTWYDQHKDFRIIETEKTVWGSRWAGTLDIDCHLNDKRYIIDLKTSKRHYPKDRYQVAAYRWAMNNEIIGKCKPSDLKHFATFVKENEIKGCGVLRLDKYRPFEKNDWKDTSKTYEKDLACFQSMVETYFHMHPIVAKRFEHITPF